MAPATTTLAAIATFIKADHGPTIHRYARIAGTVIALVITLAIIATETAYDLGRQTREAIEARNDQLAGFARAMVEWADGITIEFMEIIVPEDEPVLAVVAAAPRKRAPRKPATPAAVAAPAPARKPRTRKAAVAA